MEKKELAVTYVNFIGESGLVMTYLETILIL